jgi:catechol 2,3-dioxygenase-like lactoylglutathione lyase family enzyme
MTSYKQDHIHVTSPEPRRAAQFYIDVMGAKIVDERTIPDRIIIDLDLGGVPLRISSRTGADDNLGGLKLGLHHIGLLVDDLDKAAELMRPNGVKFIVEPYTTDTGGKIAFIQAPDGVIFDLIQK